MHQVRVQGCQGTRYSFWAMPYSKVHYLAGTIWEGPASPTVVCYCNYRKRYCRQLCLKVFLVFVYALIFFGFAEAYQVIYLGTVRKDPKHQARFCEALAGNKVDISEVSREFFALPGEAIPNPITSAEINYKDSTLVCSHLIRALRGQEISSPSKHR
jgi:hypothetical protein